MSKTAGKTAEKLPVYMKYANTVSQTWLDPAAKLKPSDLVKPSIDIVPDDYPMIIEFNKMADNTSNVHSVVDIDQPLFQPAPKIVMFEEYGPFSIVEKKIYFRNKDNVNRRIKIMKPDSPFFEVSAPKSMNGEPLMQTKIASGMEIYFILTFRPQEVRDYSYDLICSTEREKFIVPIRAVGTRPMLTFPDEIDFGFHPIKSPSQKKIMVQNIGTAVARFTMRSSNPLFTCPTQDLAIEAGASESVELFFTPADMQPANGEIAIEFQKGVTAYIAVSGVGRNADVSLSTPSLTLEPSYISLLSQKSLRIRNLSDSPISYMWKSFSCEIEEDAERDRLQQELNRMEEMEFDALRDRIESGYYNSLSGAEGEEEFMEDAPGALNATYGSIHTQDYPAENSAMLQQFSAGEPIPMAAKADQASLVRKYRNLRKALEKDDMQFVDDIFEISPIEGQVWAHSEIEITVCFRPDTAALYNCLAFLDVSGRHDRLALQLTGQGIGPHAALSCDVMDIGDVYVNDESNYEIKIKNKGDIPAQWSFMSSLTKFGNKFKFSPTEGFLKPSESQKISIAFESDMLGEFSEHFRFALQGNEDMLVCQIKGHVIGPTFHFDATSIDFGTVSFDYLHSTTVTMVNTSSVPMVFSLHVPQDGTYLKKEFNIEPSHGTLGPSESVEILVEFIPSSVKVYAYSLAVDLLGVGDVVASLPITAECVVSTVKLELPSRELDFGDCFIRYPYEKDLLITNMSSTVHTKFELMPQLKQTKSVGTFETEPSIAVIEPGDSMVVKVRLVAQKLGPFKVPLTINVAGSKEPPLQAVLSFNTIGPKIALDATEMRWGNIECLKDATNTIKLTNVGLTTASMRLFLKMARSCYRLAVRELTLEAAQSYDLEVTANLDDSVVNKDEMHIVVDEGDSLMVPLVAKGIGTTMYCKQEVDVLDLGVQLTNNYFEKQIVLENKGRRPQQLKWSNLSVKNENAERLTKAKKLGKDIGPGQRLPKNLSPVEPMFTVTPEEITLRSRTATTFTFKGYSATPKQVSEQFILESKVGKDRYMKQIIQSDVRCTIVNPLLEFSLSDLSFLYTWERDVHAAVQKRDLVLTNTSSIALSFSMKTEIPFNLSCWEATLAPGQKVEVTVEFDPIYKDDRLSHVIDKYLTIIYRGHPQKDSIPLRAEVIFPNLVFDQTAVAFGCVLNDTSKTLKVKATNSCKIDVNYEWIFLENAAPKHKARGSVLNSVPPSQVFDILPVKSLLRPGAAEDVEFCLYGNANTKFNGTVVCVVEGGPEYKFPISGEASTVSYALSRSVIDFGKVVFTDRADEELEIFNQGKVPFNYSVVPATSTGAQVLELIPPSGKVPANGSAKCIVRVRPGLPIAVHEELVVQVAHFDPVRVSVYCQGTFPTAVITLPHYRKMGPYGETEGVDSAMWDAFHAAALANIASPDPTVLPPSLPFPAPATGSTALPPVYAPGVLPPVPPEPVDDATEVGSVGATRSHASLASGNTKGAQHAILEVEMQRMVLARHLTQKIRDLQANSPEQSNDSQSPSYSPNSPSGGLQALIAQNIRVSSIVAAQYVCDFGNVIVGQTRKKIFKVTNASLVGKLNWVFDKKHLTGSGFSVEPEKVAKMAEGSTLDFMVKFFARMQVAIGQRTSILPLESPGSPTINLVLTANICLPEVEMSTAEMDFGRVLIGQSTKMFMQLHNPTPVTSNWTMKKIPGKDDGKFAIEPSAGSLRPGKKALVCVEFISSDAHKCSVDVQVRVDLNKKAKSLKLVGEGFGVPLKFEPSVVELGPVMPFTDGDEKIVTVTNNSDVDVEFFSTDFDPVYREEEAKLSQITHYDEQGILRTNIRLAGDSLPADIQAAYDQLLQEQTAAGEATSAVSSKESVVDSGAGEAPMEGAEEGLPAEPAAEEVSAFEDAPIRSKAAPRDERKHQDFVLFGPPVSGVSSHAAQMAKKLQLPVMTFDQVLVQVANTNHPVGAIARVCTNTVSVAEEQEFVAKEEELVAIAEQSKLVAEEAYKKEKKGKAKEIPPEVYLTPEVAAVETLRASRLLSQENLSKLLRFRTTWEDAGHGIIFDGIYSKFVEPELLLKSIEHALPDALLTHININRGEEGYAAWLAGLYESKTEEIERLLHQIALNKKLFLKAAAVKPKAGAKVPVTPVTLPLLVEGDDLSFAETLPVGDESWVHPATGLVTELEPNDFKSLEERERIQYLRQVLFQQASQIKQIQRVLANIARIWSPQSGLLAPTSDAPATANAEDSGEPPAAVQSAETTEDASATAPAEEGVSPVAAKPAEVLEASPIYYADYVAKVLPVLPSLKKGNYFVHTAGAEDVSVVSPEVASTAAAEGETPIEPVVASDNSEAAAAAESTEEAVSVSDGEAVPLAENGGLYEISIDGDEPEETVYASITALLPPPMLPPRDKDAIPPACTFQVHRKPGNRPNRRPIKLFKILDVETGPTEEELAAAAAAQAQVAAALQDTKSKKGGKTAAAPEPEPPAVVAIEKAPVEQKYRWVVPAHGSVQLRVKFASVAEGKPESTMEFEVVGTHQKFLLPCKGVCEYPMINSDTRNIFMRRAKGLNANPLVPLPSKRYVIADNFYSFGPLNLFKKPDWKVALTETSTEEEKERMEQITATNMDVIRVTNSGLYKCQVDVGFLTKEEEASEIFHIDPPKLELEEGETKEVKLWALPKEAKEYRNDLVLCVSNNPAPLVFPLKCWGTDPILEIAGPWDEALTKAEQALAANTDKKATKDLETKLAALKEALTLDFDRILIGKSDTRSFTITNKSLLPIEWEVDLGEFKDSANISISPLQGILPIGTSLPVVVTFTSPDPLMLMGKFSLRYADHEGGLKSSPPRFTTTSFRAVAEAYKITAVSLNSQGSETGGSEIDFGLMRVGDNAVQTMKMGNKGKYQIGYAFKLTTALANKTLTISPMEGLIETGSALADIKVSFCSKEGELLLKNNKDVVVEIIEPLTKEVVERFPLFISAQAKYSKFRLQPSKGISFGAVRFDSDHKTKRVELRNEGAFEMTYVVCPAIVEHDELDSLDGPAFACYAQGVPAALRLTELGEGYVERVKGADTGAAGKGGKKAEKAPAKGKGAAPAGPTSTLNPLVIDPDELPVAIAPEDPLVVGSFTVLPRIGVVQPGQSVGIDMTFDPSGCETVKERMRLCVSGADPKDALTTTIKTFEVTGESCVPAIVTEDVNSIFEEQEIVSSLADSTGEKSSEGGGKVEKLAVGKVVFAEAEKMLAFGPVSCSAASGRGVVERVKISNPTKIDIKVKFNVLTPEEAAERANASASADLAKGGKSTKEKAPAGKGGKGAPAVEEPKANVFTVNPPRWEIPPHEHRFVNIYFNPTEIKSYRSVFLAQIDDEGTQTSAVAKVANSGKSLTFELGGSGTLPCITFDQPTDFTADGDLLVPFTKVLVNRSSRKKMVIRNDGVMPATCLFDLIGDDDFIFPAKGTSLTVNPGCKEDVFMSFSPKSVVGDGIRKATIKVSVLNNQFDSYRVQLTGSAYSCDAIIDTVIGEDNVEQTAVDEGEGAVQHDVVPFADINLADGPGKSVHTVVIRSQSDVPMKFEMQRGPDVPDVLDFSPTVGHLAPRGTREVTITFRADAPTHLVAAPVVCTFKRIAYPPNAESGEAESDQALWGVWDDSMKSARVATAEDVENINAATAALKEYNAKVETEKAKGKKGKPVGPPPERCLLELGPTAEDGTQTVFEIVAEPAFELVKDSPEQQLSIACNGVADIAKYICEGDDTNVTFTPTFLFQTTTHKFELKNESKIKLPVKWVFEDLKRGRGQTRSFSATLGNQSRIGTAGNSSIPCPFSIEEEEAEVPANAVKQFTMKFFPLEVDDFVYLLRGVTLSTPAAEGTSPAGEGPVAGIRMIIRGSAKRPICHFDIDETGDYMSRRPLNMKNEIGLNSPIEVTDIKVVELESVGLHTRNTFRFHITNPTNDNYEFLWETMGEPSPFWRCVQGAGMMFAGKRVEVVFEYLPEEVNVAEAFFKFRIPTMGLEQVFLFTGKVAEPKVLFTTSKIDFHSVMLGGEGSSETIYLENKEHLPFQFAIDKYSLLQLDGPNGPVLDIVPKQGTVPPHGKMAINLHFHPQEEVIYNFNIVCTVKRKPNKLSLNIKGEGYAVHPFIQLEGAENGVLAAVLAGGADLTSSTSSVSSRYMTLRPAPAVNYADFGAVQVLDTIAKTMTVTNNGKFNFDYHWDIDSISPMLSLTGGKLGGTLLKADELNYKLTFAPTREGPLNGSMLSFTVAGKYVYNIVPRGSGVKPALRFSFMHHDFGPCFVTSPGGSTVVEETVLQVVNHDPKSNIAVECTFQKTRALWAECAPTVIAPGGVLEVPIRFAPREVKDYAFVIPFVVNGATKVPVNILGSGINARLELVNGSQRRTNFGLVNVGSSTTRSVAIVNRSKRALPVELIEEGEYGAGALSDRCVSFSPKGEFIIAPRDTVSLQLVFNPSKRISQFTEDLSIRYAGVTRKLLALSGKAQGTEIALDSDSLPFGLVVLDSQKIKKLTLENTGDLTITFQWQEATFGQHFTITPLSGKILPGNEASFDVTFKPKCADEDIRQDNITLMIPGIEPLKLTCTGGCVPPPAESTQTLEFQSLARKAQEKTVKIQNPTDKDWYLSPSLQGIDWKVPHEFKVPARGAADLAVTYFPLTMTTNKQAPVSESGEAPTEPFDPAHKGQLFIALPDGSAQLYKLRGEAGEPECSGQVTVETSAKKPATVILKVKNWLPETQQLDVSVSLTEKPTPASFIVAANVTEIGPNGTKEFPLRFISHTDGLSKGRITFTNPVTGEYAYFELAAKTTMPEVLETIAIESPVRQTARYIIAVENPLPRDMPVAMGSLAKPSEWWSCDCPYIKVNELNALSGNSEGSFEVEYRPLKPTAQPAEHLLTIMTKELGTCKYKVVVKATPPLLKQVLRFDAPLGSMQSESFIFHTYNLANCTYTCSVKKPESFTVQSSLSVGPVSAGWEGEDARLNVVFEPTVIGEVRDTLTVTSPEGGEYICELIGNCTAPMPQGPYNLIQGAGAVDIPFRNCFSATSTWTFNVDSAAFRIAAPVGTATVNAKTQSQVSVVFEPKEEHMNTPGGVVTAKLFVTCTSIKNTPPWIFYLQGKIDQNATGATAKGGKK